MVRNDSGIETVDQFDGGTLQFEIPVEGKGRNSKIEKMGITELLDN